MKIHTSHPFNYLLLIFLGLFIACSTPDKSDKTPPTEAITGSCVADTIIYSVVIKNPDSLDLWTEKCLSQLKRREMVDQVFDAIYKHKAEAFSYFNHEPLSVPDIKELEEREAYSRDKVAKLQFWETWYFDEKKLQMQKKVHAILVAYEIFTEDNELRGYRAGFYIKMKK